MSLKDKVAIVIGGGQTPGDKIGNGRATAILFAREGARVLVADRDGCSALETQTMIDGEGGAASTFEADAADDRACRALIETCLERYGRIDILHNKVGIGAGDAELVSLDEAVWDVAQEALFLASDDAKFITGVVLPVDGRQSARIG